MGAKETVEVTGHLMDTGILSRILDDIRDYGGDYVLDMFEVGHEAHDPSSARITVEADDDESLQRLLMRLQTRGVNPTSTGEASTRPAEVMVPTVSRTCSLFCAETSLTSLDMAPSTSRERATKTSPAAVSPTFRLFRLNSSTPSSFSRSRIWALRADWETCNRAAARLKCLSSATARA